MNVRLIADQMHVVQRDTSDSSSGPCRGRRGVERGRGEEPVDDFCFEWQTKESISPLRRQPIYSNIEFIEPVHSSPPLEYV